MNFKLKALVAAALLSVAGSASAITAANTVTSDGNAYLLLTVLDTNFNGGVGRSYTRSLEVSLNDFGTQNRPTGGFSINVDAGGNQSWAAGSLWSDFTAGMDSAQIAGLKWDVTALDSFGTNAVDTKRILTTSSTDLVSLQSQSGAQIINGEVNNAVLDQYKYWDAAIAEMGAGTEIMISDPVSTAFAISVAVHSNNFSGKITDFSTMANVGDSMGFYYLTRNGSSSSTQEALAAAYGNTLGASAFTLAANGELSFAPPVPEASTYGMMLAGLGLVGFMAGRRRRV
jgi:hypothetical protein